MRILPTLLVLVAAAVGYASLFPLDADATIAGNDAVSYALALESDDPARIVDAHHPVFHALAYGVYRVRRLAVPDDPLASTWALRAVSALGGAATLALLFALARGAGVPIALALTAFAGTSLGLAIYSAVGESYTPALAASCLVLALVLRRVAARATLPVAALVLPSVLALGLRQDSILVIPVVALAFLVPDGTDRAARARRATRYLAATAAGTLLVYAAAYAVHATGTDPNPSPLSWLLHLAETGKWGRFGGIPPAQALWIAAETTAGSWDYGLTWTSSLAIGPDPGIPDVLPSLPTALVWALPCVPFVGFLVRASLARPRAAALVVLFVLLRLVFFAWWQPANMEYQFGNAFPLLVLAAVDVSRDPPRRGRALLAPGLLAIAVFVGWRNEGLLLGALRQRTLAARAEHLAEWQRAGARIVAVDEYVAWSLQRFGAVPHATFLPGADEPTRAALDTLCRAALHGGAPVVFATDTVLPRALGLDRWAGPERAYWNLDHVTQLLARVGASGPADGIRPHGADPAWAIVVGARIEDR